MEWIERGLWEPAGVHWDNDDPLDNGAHEGTPVREDLDRDEPESSPEELDRLDRCAVAQPQFWEAAPSSKFLSILGMHEECDIVIACQPGSRGARGQADGTFGARFYCHLWVLQRRCSLFANEANFESAVTAATPAQEKPVAKKARQLELPAADDIVFEVLRYVYCGTIHFRQGFASCFLQFLSVVDFLGIEEMAERETEANAVPPSIFVESGVQHWLSYLPAEELLALLLDGNVAGTPKCGGIRTLGFTIRRQLVERLAELRPRDFTEAALGKALYRRLMHLGESPSPRSAMSVGPILPGPVLFVELQGSPEPWSHGSSLQVVQLRGPEAVYDAAPMADRPGRLWHRCEVVEPGVTRQRLLLGGSPDRTVVLFHESTYGREAFDRTLERARQQNDADATMFRMCLDNLMTTVGKFSRKAQSEKTLVTVVYDDHIELCQDMELRRSGPYYMGITKVRAGGRADRAGLGESWLLTKRPPELILMPLWHLWKPLENLFLRFSPGDTAIVVKFPERPFGFSWSQDTEQLVVSKVAPDGRAAAEGVKVGMVVQSFTRPCGQVLESMTEIVAAIRGDETPSEIGFVPVRRHINAQFLAGVTLKEVEPAVIEQSQTSLSGQAQCSRRRVVVEKIPAGHPTQNLGLVVGWQLIDMRTGVHGQPKNLPIRVTSLQQLPVELRGPFKVSLEFVAPSPLSDELPLDLWPGEVLRSERIIEEGPGNVPAVLQGLSSREIMVEAEGADAETGADVFANDAPHSFIGGIASSSSDCPADAGADAASAATAATTTSSSSQRSVWPLQYVRRRLRKVSEDSDAEDDHVSGMSSGSTSTARRASGSSGTEYDCEVLVLGSMPPVRYRLQKRIAGANGNESLARELYDAWEAAGRSSLEEAAPERAPLVAAAVRWRRRGSPSSSTTPAGIGATNNAGNVAGPRTWRMGEVALQFHARESWLGGLIMGESVSQIVFRCSMMQESSPLFQSIIAHSLRPAPPNFPLQAHVPGRAHEAPARVQ